MKKLLSIFMVVLMMFGVLSITANATNYYDFYEEEPNDYMYLSDRIYNNCSITGYISDYDDLDCYEFVLPYRTTVYVTCCSGVGSILLGISDLNGNIITVAQGAYDREEQLYFDSVAITLDAGTYYISMVADYDFVYTNELYVVIFNYEIKSNQHTHYYTSSVVKPSCYENGYTTYTCACGDSYTEETPAKHYPVKVLESIPATYSSDGLTAGSVCLTCGEEIVSQTTIPMLELKKVSNLKATSIGDTSIKLSWSAVKGAKKYEVFYKEDGGWVSLTVKTNKATLKDLNSDTKYPIRVKAICGDNEGEVSKTLSVTTKLSKTSKITTNNGIDSIKASWKKVPNASGYKVELLNSKGKVLKTVDTEKTKYTFKKLSKTTNYKIRVTAYKISGEKKKYSDLRTIISTSTAPSKVVLSKLTAGSKSITPVWSAVNGVSGYEVQYSTSSKFKNAKTVTEKKNNKKTIKKLKKGQKYYVRVRAYKLVDDKKVYGTWSAIKSIKAK